MIFSSFVFSDFIESLRADTYILVLGTTTEVMGEMMSIVVKTV